MPGQLCVGAGLVFSRENEYNKQLKLAFCPSGDPQRGDAAWRSYMERATTVISPQDIQSQLDHCQAVAQRNARLPQSPLAFVDTYGCPLV